MSYVNERVCSLILRTCDASNRGSDNPSYLINTFNGTYWRWDNINLEAVLGDLALKYRRFNLILISVQQCTAATTAAIMSNSPQDAVLNFRLRASGLNFLNSMFNVRDDRYNGNTCLAGGYTMSTGQNTIPQILNLTNQINTFEFSNTSVTLELFYERGDNRARPTVNPNTLLPLPFLPLNTGATYPEMVWIFKIYPVKESYVDKDINNFNNAIKIKI